MESRSSPSLLHFPFGDVDFVGFDFLLLDLEELIDQLFMEEFMSTEKFEPSLGELSLDFFQNGSWSAFEKLGL